MIAFIPIVIVFATLQRFFFKGVEEGAVKDSPPHACFALVTVLAWNRWRGSRGASCVCFWCPVPLQLASIDFR